MSYIYAQPTDIALKLSNRAHLPALSQWAIRFAMVIVTWDDRSKMRYNLRNMPAHQLEDMGITPEQARIECRKPFWKS